MWRGRPLGKLSRSCLSQVRDARREANDVVPLEPLTKAELEARLKALRESIVLPVR